MKRIITLLVLLVSMSGYTMIEPYSLGSSNHTNLLNASGNIYSYFGNNYYWSWPDCRNTDGSSPEQPSSVFLGDNATFGHESWSTVDGNYPKWRVFIHTGTDINNGIPGNWSGTSNIEHKTNISARFTSVGTWYWGFEVDYSTDGSKWYCRNNSSWSGMWGSPTSNLTITVNALNNPATYSAAVNSSNPSTQIDLSWTKDAQSHNVMILRKKSTASWTEPTQGNVYTVGNTIGAATVVYNGSGTSFTDNVNSSTSYDYKFYSENYSYYSSGVSPSTVTTNTATTDRFRSKTTGNWNSATTWESSYDNSFWITATTYPGADCYVASVESGHVVSLSADAAVKNATIKNGGTLNLGSYTLTLAAGGSLSNQSTGTFNSGTGTLYYYGAGGGSILTIGGNLSFNNVTVENGGINFGSSSTVTGTFTIKNFGWVETNGPAYSSGSTLVYAPGGTFTVASEWNSPDNVSVSNNTEIDFTGDWDPVIYSNLIIESGSTVKLSSTTGADLFVKGNFTNQGTFNSNNREVVFNGTGIQEINGSSATTFSYLRVNNAAGITMNSSNPVTVTDRLAVDAGQITIPPLRALTVSGLTQNNTGNSCITVKSDATGTGSLIHNTAGIKGTIERYITGSADPHAMMYHFVSVPLDTANASYSGLFEGSYLFYFREDTNYWKGLGSPLYTPLDETRGYLIYYILGNSTTYTFEGNMNYTSFTPHLESHATSSTDYTHGWNLIPNPFPSAINWDASGWTKTDIGGSVYLWPAGVSSDAANYCIWNGTSGTGNPPPSGYIPSGQSFFVHASSTLPSLVIPASAKAHNKQAYYKNGAEIVPNLLRMRVFGTDSTTSDDLIVHFREDATSTFDNEFDAFKLTGGYKAPQLSTITSDGINVAINSLPLVSGQQIVPVKLKYYTPAQLKFTFEGIENFEHQPTIFLEDKLENRLIDLTVQPEYTFDYSTNDTARFNLIFTDYTGTEKHETSSFNAYQLNDKIRILYPELSGNKATVRIFDMTGKLISSNSLVFEDVVSVNAPAVPGVYVIQVLSGNKALSRRIVIL